VPDTEGSAASASGAAGQSGPEPNVGRHAPNMEEAAASAAGASERDRRARRDVSRGAHPVAARRG